MLHFGVDSVFDNYAFFKHKLKKKAEFPVKRLFPFFYLVLFSYYKCTERQTKKRQSNASKFPNCRKTTMDIAIQLEIMYFLSLLVYLKNQSLGGEIYIAAVQINFFSAC